MPVLFELRLELLVLRAWILHPE